MFPHLQQQDMEIKNNNTTSRINLPATKLQWRNIINNLMNFMVTFNIHSNDHYFIFIHDESSRIKNKAHFTVTECAENLKPIYHNPPYPILFKRL